MAKFPAAKVKLTGEDGNAFSIIARTSKALRAAGATKEEIAEFQKDATSGNYSHLITTVSDWVSVI